LTRLARLWDLDIYQEILLTGFVISSFILFFFKLGEFPLVEGSFRKLTCVDLPDDENSSPIITSFLYLEEEIFMFISSPLDFC